MHRQRGSGQLCARSNPCAGLTIVAIFLSCYPLPLDRSASHVLIPSRLKDVFGTSGSTARRPSAAQLQLVFPWSVQGSACTDGTRRRTERWTTITGACCRCSLAAAASPPLLVRSPLSPLLSLCSALAAAEFITHDGGFRSDVRQKGTTHSTQAAHRGAAGSTMRGASRRAAAAAAAISAHRILSALCARAFLCRVPTRLLLLLRLLRCDRLFVAALLPLLRPTPLSPPLLPLLVRCADCRLDLAAV